MIYFDVFEKDSRTFIRLDITDIFSKKHKVDYKIELKYKDKILQEICNYSILEIEENDEYSFFVAFDITNIDFEKLKYVMLIQYKKSLLSRRETVYHTFHI